MSDQREVEPWDPEVERREAWGPDTWLGCSVLAFTAVVLCALVWSGVLQYQVTKLKGTVAELQEDAGAEIGPLQRRVRKLEKTVEDLKDFQYHPGDETHLVCKRDRYGRTICRIPR
jgi:hypothetical protein